MEVERRRDERVRFACAVLVVVVSVEDERDDAPVDVAQRAVPKVRPDERKGALLIPVRRREQRQGVEVAAVFSLPLEEERRDPVVVLVGGLTMRERSEDQDVVVTIAYAPERREEDVGVQLRRPALIEKQASERFAIGVRSRSSGLRIKPTCLLEIKGRGSGGSGSRPFAPRNTEKTSDGSGLPAASARHRSRCRSFP